MMDQIFMAIMAAIVPPIILALAYLVLFTFDWAAWREWSIHDFVIGALLLLVVWCLWAQFLG